MENRLIKRLQGWLDKPKRKSSFLRFIASGAFVKVSDFRSNTSLHDIKAKIDTMRNLAADSQISTALSYYATDSTTANSAGHIIWATSDNKELSDLINTLFKRWKINSYVRDHILELATIGNLYIPTTQIYRESADGIAQTSVALDNNTIPEWDYDIVPSYKIPPEDVLHIWQQGSPVGYIYQPDSDTQNIIVYPETAIIHFSLGGILGDYTIDTTDKETGQPITYDVQFAEPLMGSAVVPTQTLSLLEDSMLLSSLIRVVKFINVDCSQSEEEEIENILLQMKNAIEQQMSINTANGDAQSFLNPQSPNNLIYLPKVNGTDAISITDLNMAENTEADNKLLDYYQNKKLSVLGIPKEAMNFSSAEGLGAAGTVMSQRSALYANILQRLMTAYISGWTEALNMYFRNRNMSGFVDKFTLHMNPVVTTQSTIQFEKRDSALNQAQTLVQMLKDAGITDSKTFRKGLVEILTEAFPQMGSDAAGWDINVNEADEVGGGGVPGGI